MASETYSDEKIIQPVLVATFQIEHGKVRIAF